MLVENRLSLLFGWVVSWGVWPRVSICCLDNGILGRGWGWCSSGRLQGCWSSTIANGRWRGVLKIE